MKALLISVAVAAVLAVGAGLGGGALVASIANGQNSNQTLYNYGQR
jgi:hypothetical protein